MTKLWRAMESAVLKGQSWEAGIYEGKGYNAVTVCRVYRPSEEAVLRLAKEVAEAVNRNRRVKAIMESELDEDALLRDMIKEWLL